MTDVSVIIPTFRRPTLLPEAIASALAQTGVSVEVRVLDDSPEGSAREIVERVADPRVTYIKHEPATGGKPALVRNAGWPGATGRFVHFLDDDDRVAAGFYRAALAAFDARPDRGVVFGRIEPFGDDPDALAHERAFFDDAARRARIAAATGSRLVMTTNLLFRPTLLVNSACLIRRDCIGPLGGYDPELSLNEDVDFYCRAIREYNCVFLDRTVLHYRILSTSLMHGNKDATKLESSYHRMYGRYRGAHGAPEFLAMKALARTVLRLV
jgi:glycosyltransferase involved in cell wall biosynthesis